MDLDQDLLRKFLAVAEELNFSRAADRLHISQPAVSASIRRLETSLGSSLFQRDHRGVSLSDFGRKFVDIAQTLVAQHREALHASQMAAQGGGWRLRVGYCPFMDLAVVSSVQTRFPHTKPGIEVQLSSVPTASQARLLTEGNLDVGLLVGPVDGHGLYIEHLAREPFMVGLPRGHTLARRSSLTLAEVCKEPIIWLPHQSNPALHDWFLANCKASGCSPRIALEVTTVPEFMQFVSLGHGVTLLPRCATAVKVIGVSFRELVDANLNVDVVAAYSRTNDSDLKRSFVAFVKKQSFPGTSARRSRKERMKSPQPRSPSGKSSAPAMTTFAKTQPDITTTAWDSGS